MTALLEFNIHGFTELRIFNNSTTRGNFCSSMAVSSLNELTIPVRILLTIYCTTNTNSFRSKWAYSGGAKIMKICSDGSQKYLNFCTWWWMQLTPSQQVVWRSLVWMFSSSLLSCTMYCKNRRKGKGRRCCLGDRID